MTRTEKVQYIINAGIIAIDPCNLDPNDNGSIYWMSDEEIDMIYNDTIKAQETEEQTTETTETEEVEEENTVEKIKVVYEKKKGRTYTETWRSEKPEEVYERLAHCLIAKKLNNCRWIRSIKRVPLYNGFDRITITHDNGGRDVYTVASH